MFFEEQTCSSPIPGRVSDFPKRNELALLLLSISIVAYFDHPFCSNFSLERDTVFDYLARNIEY